MTNDARGLLDVLRAELEFAEKGGYRQTERAAWRPHFVFRDSPTCLNYDSTKPPKPCSDCVLMKLIPEDARGLKVPCRYIPLNERGETIDSFYRTGTQEELEAAVAKWLKATIDRLEREKAHALPTEERLEVHVKAKFVSAE